MKWLGSLRACKLGRCRRRRAAAALVPGPVRVRSKTLTEQPGPDGGQGAAARAALQPLPFPDQHLPAPPAPRVMEARRSRAAGGRSDLRGWAAPPPTVLWLWRLEAASRSGLEWRGRHCYAPGPAPEARPQRRLAPQSQGPLATSFFHSQKRERKKKKKEKRQEKRWGKIVPRTPAVTGASHLGAPLVERGRWAGKGRRKKGIGRLGGPAPGPASRRRSLPLLFPPPPPNSGREVA